jgi:RNA polymerase sigma-70 factor (ECF subfamily)
MEIVTVWKDLQQPLRSFIIQRTRDEAAADDILQEVFLKIQSNIAQLRDPQKVNAWIFQIARHAIADHYREAKSTYARNETFGDHPAEELSFEEADLNQQLAAWLPSAIELLPEKYREAVRLTEIEGLSQKELAERLGISYSGAKSRVQRGREKLKEVILQCCEVQSDGYGNILGYQPRPPEPKEEECCD